MSLLERWSKLSKVEQEVLVGKFGISRGGKDNLPEEKELSKVPSHLLPEEEKPKKEAKKIVKQVAKEKKAKK